MVMRYFWIQDRIEQGLIFVVWRQGSDNAAYSFTKHHSTAHHRLMSQRYVQDKPPSLPGCVDSNLALSEAQERMQCPAGVHVT